MLTDRALSRWRTDFEGTRLAASLPEQAVLTVTCPSGFSGGCHSKIYIQITHGRLLHTKATIKAGKSKTVPISLPKTATTARAHARTLVLDAAVVTNNYATSKTIRVHIK